MPSLRLNQQAQNNPHQSVGKGRIKGEHLLLDKVVGAFGIEDSGAVCSNGIAKARMQVALALAEMGHFDWYKHRLRHHSTAIRNTQERSASYLRQMSKLTSAIHSQSSTDGLTAGNSLGSAIQGWVGTVAVHCANNSSLSADQTMHGTMEGTHTSISTLLKSEGFSDNVADDFASALVSSVHMVTSIVAADPDTDVTQQQGDDLIDTITENAMQKIPGRLSVDKVAHSARFKKIVSDFKQSVAETVSNAIANSTVTNAYGQDLQRQIFANPFGPDGNDYTRLTREHEKLRDDHNYEIGTNKRRYTL